MATFLSQDGRFRIAIVRAPVTANRARAVFDLNPLAAVLFGDILLGALLDVAMAKGGARTHIKAEGNGPLRQLNAEATHTGEVRGFVADPAAEVPGESAEDLKRNALGIGLLHVTRIQEDMQQPRTSTVSLKTSRIPSDLADFYTHSDQIPSALRIDIIPDEAMDIAVAAGILVQRVPDAAEASDAELEHIEQALAAHTWHTGANTTPDDLQHLAESILGQSVQLLRTVQVDYYCPCSKEYYAERLLGLGAAQLRELGNESQEIRCHYCNENYYFSALELQQMAAQLTPTN